MTEETFGIDTQGDVEPGTYMATLIGWVPFDLFELADGSWSRTDPEDGTEPTKRITWTFALDDQDGQTVEGVTSLAWRTDAAKLRQWAKGLGYDFAVSLRMTADQMVGRSGLVTVDADKHGYSRVVTVAPAPKAKGK